MGEAFDAACNDLHDAGQPTPALIHQIIATRIIESAKKGELDPVRLRKIALAALGLSKALKEARAATGLRLPQRLRRG
jgi:hypothetical protein